jgi:uncharacterized membrane protein
MHPIHIILYILGIAGIVLNNYRRRECFYVWLVVDYNAGLYVQAGLFATYLILAAHGLWKWKNHEN